MSSTTKEKKCKMSAALLLLLFVSSAFGRIHRLQLEDDSRRIVTVSAFGFLTGGTLTVNLTLFKTKASGRAASGAMPKFDFTLDKSKSISLPSEYDDTENTCILDNPDFKYPLPNYIRFSFDLEQNRVLIQPVGSDVQRLLVSDQPRHDFLKAHSESQSNDSGVGLPEVPEKSVTFSSVDLSGIEDGGYQIYFWVSIRRPEEEGQYFLRFHNCPGNHDDSGAQVTLKMEITEDNNGNFLTAGEMPVPALYFIFSVLFFIAGVAWLSVVRRSQEDVYKIHYLMLVVVFVKSLACLLYGTNMHFIQIYGIRQDVWAVLWYIISSMEEVLLVVTLLLMAVGWACQKSHLARREKVVLCFALFFQVLHQVGEIILLESEEGEASRSAWQDTAILTKFLCWSAVLVPAVWTLRSLKNAFGVQVKAIVRPYTSKLFGYFYCLVVVYIYITQIVVYLLKMALTFRQLWVSVLSSESATLLFFLLSGVLFRPARGHFYTPVSQDCDSACTPTFQDGDNTCIELPENDNSACGLEPPDCSAYKDTETEVDKMLAEKDNTGSDVHANQQPEGSTDQKMQQKN